MFELTIETDFASAHQLRGYKGKCENMHGHNWKVQATVTSDKLNNIDIAIDFGDLRKITNDIIAPLDHTCLNTIFPFTEINPSSENISKWIYESLKKRLPEGINVASETASATYYED